MPIFIALFLEAQLDVTTHSVKPSLAGRLAISALSPLFVNRFGRSLRFCHLEFNKKAISDSHMSKNTRYRCIF